MLQQTIHRCSRRFTIGLATIAIAILLLPESVRSQESDSETVEDVAVVPGPNDAIPAPVEDADADGPGLLSRVVSGDADGLDWFLLSAGVMLAVALVWIIWSYVRGLRGSPR